MKQSIVAHSIKHRVTPNDEFITPVEVARMLITKVPFATGDVVLDAAYGTGVFYDNYPEPVYKYFTKDFYNYDGRVDWIVTNPPYSGLEQWLIHSFEIANKGVAYLIGLHNITPRRLEIAGIYGFGVTFIHIHKVCPWYGIQAFVVWEKNKPSIISYDRTVWGSNKPATSAQSWHG